MLLTKKFLSIAALSFSVVLQSSPAASWECPYIPPGIPTTNESGEIVYIIPTPKESAQSLFYLTFGENGTNTLDEGQHFLIGSLFNLDAELRPYMHELDLIARRERWELNGYGDQSMGTATYEYRSVLGFEGIEVTRDGAVPFTTRKISVSITCYEFCDNNPVLDHEYYLNATLDDDWYVMPKAECSGGYGRLPNDEVVPLFLQCVENDGCPWAND